MLKLINKLRYYFYIEKMWIKKFVEFYKEYKTVTKDSYVIFCAPDHGNIGDHAIIYSELKFLKNMDPSRDIIEIPSFLMKHHSRLIAMMIGKRLIFITGGGFLGTLWLNEEKIVRRIIQLFPMNKIIIFPQTIYFDNSFKGRREKSITKHIYDEHPNLWLFAREEETYQIAKEMFSNVHVELVPDMVPYLNGLKDNPTRKGALLCLRKDKEKQLSVEDTIEIKEILSKYIPNEAMQNLDTVMEYNIGKSDREKEINKTIREFSKYRIIITDRLHGMVFAALAGTPCITLSNCNHKVKGIYNWIKENEYIVYLEDISKLNYQVNRVIKMKNNKFKHDSLREKYRILENIIKAN